MKTPTRLLSGVALLLSLAFLIPPRYVRAQTDSRAQALALEQQGKTAEAEQQWHEVLSKHPGNAEAYAHLGLLDARKGDYPAAIRNYRKTLAIQPNFPGVPLDLGLALFKNSQFSEAASVFQAQLRKNPGDLRMSILTGMAYYGAGKYSRAVPYLELPAKRDPQNLSLRLTLAHSCLWSKQYACVLSTYRQILALNAGSAEADMLAGEAMDGLGNVTGAIEQFRAAARTNPSEPNVHFGLGYLLWTQKQYAEAEVEFRAELKNNPEQSKAQAYLGDTLVREQQYARAEPVLRKAIAHDASFALPFLDLGIIEADSGRNTEAVHSFQKSIALDPNNADSHWRLARLYQHIGEQEKARTEFAKVSTLKKAQDKSPRPLDIH